MSSFHSYCSGLCCHSAVAVVVHTPARYSHLRLHLDLKVDCSELCHMMMDWVPSSGLLNTPLWTTWRFSLSPKHYSSDKRLCCFSLFHVTVNLIKALGFLDHLSGKHTDIITLGSETSWGPCLIMVSGKGNLMINQWPENNQLINQ